MPTKTAFQNSLQTVEQFLATVGTVKTAEANTEAGGYDGPTTHPVKNVDDRTEDAKEGARSTENSKDVKEDQGTPGVDATPEAKSSKTAAAKKALAGLAKKAEGETASKPGSAADDQLQIGTNKQPTGEDSSVETSSAKGGKDDPGSSHPARTDNDELDGHKYASAPLEKLAAHTQQLGEQLCLLLSDCVDDDSIKQAAATATAPVTDDAALAFQAGSELAALVGGTFDKQAADALVERTLTEIIKTAADDAVRVADYLDGYFAETQQKRAEGPPAMPTGSGAVGGGGEPAMGEEAMMSAMGGMGGGGGDGDGDEGGQMANMSPEQILAVLEHLGITPEMIQEAAQAEGGGGEGGPPGGEAGGMPPGAGGPPPGAGGEPPPPKTAAAKTPKTVATKNASHDYLRELVVRSLRASKTPAA